MKFGIISDTHDNLKNFLAAVDFLNREAIAILLHCGDICNQETIDEAGKQFKGEIFFVRGNGDFHLDEIPETRTLELGGKRIFFNHYPDVAKQAAESGNYDLVFYGHTHKPWEERIGNCRLVNPGEAAGQRFKATFAIYDTITDTLRLCLFETLAAENIDKKIK